MDEESADPRPPLNRPTQLQLPLVDTTSETALDLSRNRFVFNDHRGSSSSFSPFPSSSSSIVADDPVSPHNTTVTAYEPAFLNRKPSFSFPEPLTVYVPRRVVVAGLPTGSEEGSPVVTVVRSTATATATATSATAASTTSTGSVPEGVTSSTAVPERVPTIPEYARLAGVPENVSGILTTSAAAAASSSSSAVSSEHEASASRESPSALKYYLRASVSEILPVGASPAAQLLYAPTPTAFADASGNAPAAATTSTSTTSGQGLPAYGPYVTAVAEAEATFPRRPNRRRLAAETAAAPSDSHLRQRALYMLLDDGGQYDENIQFGYKLKAKPRWPLLRRKAHSRYEVTPNHNLPLEEEPRVLLTAEQVRQLVLSPYTLARRYPNVTTVKVVLVTPTYRGLRLAVDVVSALRRHPALVCLQLFIGPDHDRVNWTGEAPGDCGSARAGALARARATAAGDLLGNMDVEAELRAEAAAASVSASSSGDADADSAHSQPDPPPTVSPLSDSSASNCSSGGSPKAFVLVNELEEERLAKEKEEEEAAEEEAKKKKDEDQDQGKRGGNGGTDNNNNNGDDNNDIADISNDEEDGNEDQNAEVEFEDHSDYEPFFEMIDLLNYSGGAFPALKTLVVHFGTELVARRFRVAGSLNLHLIHRVPSAYLRLPVKAVQKALNSIAANGHIRVLSLVVPFSYPQGVATSELVLANKYRLFGPLSRTVIAYLEEPETEAHRLALATSGQNLGHHQEALRALIPSKVPIPLSPYTHSLAHLSLTLTMRQYLNEPTLGLLRHLTGLRELVLVLRNDLSHLQNPCQAFLGQQQNEDGAELAEHFDEYLVEAAALPRRSLRRTPRSLAEIRLPKVRSLAVTVVGEPFRRPVRDHRTLLAHLGIGFTFVNLKYLNVALELLPLHCAACACWELEGSSAAVDYRDRRCFRLALEPVLEQGGLRDRLQGVELTVERFGPTFDSPRTAIEVHSMLMRPRPPTAANSVIRVDASTDTSIN